jgi:DnaK suppressor protein
MENKKELTKETIDELKKELLERKKQILEDIKNIGADDSNSNEDHKLKFPEFGDKADENAQEISEYTTNLATEKVLEKTLRDIDNSLKRIEDGTYGICKYFKKSIGEKRMKARPVASACIDCKNKLQNS